MHKSCLIPLKVALFKFLADEALHFSVMILEHIQQSPFFFNFADKTIFYGLRCDLQIRFGHLTVDLMDLTLDSIQKGI